MKIAFLYTTSELTPWKENVNKKTLHFLQNNLHPGYSSEIVLFQGFNQKMVQKLKQFDLVYNLSYGFKNADQVDVVLWLEANTIKHTTSDSYGMKIAQDKAILPYICGKYGLFTPKIISAAEELQNDAIYIAKPRTGACHRGIQIGNGSWFHEKEYIKRKDYIIQPYIYGREFSVAVIPSLNNDTYETLPPVEISHEENSKIFIAGQQYGKTRRNFVPDINLEQNNNLVNDALTLHYKMGLKGASRTDFRMDENGNVFVLDVNAMPNMDPKFSLMPAICKFHGITICDLLNRIIYTATKQIVENKK